MTDDVIDITEDNKGGVEGRKGYVFQDTTLISDLILGLTNPHFYYAYTEHHEDYIVIYSNRIDIVQVKKRDPQQNKWSLNKSFCENVIKPFYITSQKIKTDKLKRFIFRSDGGIQAENKNSSSIFHLCKTNEIPEHEQTVEDKEYINAVIDKVAKFLGLNSDDSNLKEIISRLKYENKASLDAAIRSNRDLLQDQLKVFQLTHQQVKIIYDRLHALVSNAGAEHNEKCLEQVNEILNSNIDEKEKALKISQLKRCITKRYVLDTLVFPESPLAGKIQIFELPDEPLEFQKMMLLAKIPKKIVDLAANEYFNIEYHRKLINGLLGETGDELLNHTKGAVFSIWGNAYTINPKGEEFGKSVYAQCRQEINEKIKQKQITTPVLQHDVHAYGLLHELAEEQRITYTPEDEKRS